MRKENNEETVVTTPRVLVDFLETGLEKYPDVSEELRTKLSNVVSLTKAQSPFTRVELKLDEGRYIKEIKLVLPQVKRKKF